MNASPALDLLAFLSLPVDPQLCWLTTMSLVHSLWQGLLLALLVAIVLRMKKSLSVYQRFLACYTVLLLIGLTPVVNFLWLSGNSQPPAAVAIAHENYQAGDLSLFTLEELSTVSNTDEATDPAATPARATSATEFPPASEHPIRTTINWPVLASVLATVLYLLGAGLMLVRMGFGLRAQNRLTKTCHRNGSADTTPPSVLAIAERAAVSLGRSLKTRIVLFQGQGTALVVGMLRPLILVNASLISGLTPKQLEQIIAHELAHIYRWDPLTLLIQRIIEALLFFHPAVWLVSRQVSQLREHCCDEWVAGHDARLDYAQTLLHCVTLNQEQAQPDAKYSLAATGNGATQLTTRIESLLQPTSATLAHRSGSRWLTAMLTVVCIVSMSAIWWASNRRGSHPVATTPVPLQEVANTGDDKIPIFDDKDWSWTLPSTAQLSTSMFLFGGQELTLADSVPDDIKVESMIDEGSVQFAQWHFGDANSTRVAILVEMGDGKINRLFLDRNRDRTIQADEEITRQTNQGKTWVADLMVEVVENERKVHAPRQIGITPKLRLNALRITTLGHVDGTIPLNDKSVAVRRIDNDGNGIPTDARDQLWIDLDGDGKFDPLTERHHLQNVMQIDDQRYAVRSDRLGQSLKLTADNQRGTVRFQLDLADKTAIVESLEGSLRDEAGLLIAIRGGKDAVSVPAGRYCIENLVIRVRDTSSLLWEMTLTRGFQDGWFDIETDQQHEVKLLESLDFYATPFVDKQARPGQPTWIRPYIYTPNALVITRFDRKDASRELPNEGNVAVNFQFRGPGDVEPEQAHPCQSGFG